MSQMLVLARVSGARVRSVLCGPGVCPPKYNLPEFVCMCIVLQSVKRPQKARGDCFYGVTPSLNALCHPHRPTCQGTQRIVPGRAALSFGSCKWLFTLGRFAFQSRPAE